MDVADTPLPAESAARLEAEAIRVFRRYGKEIVEQLGVCPWAAPARRDGRVDEHVVLERTPDVARALRAIDALADLDIEIGIILFPRLSVDRRTFERWVAEVRIADERRPQPFERAFAMAEFHPAAPPLLDPAGSFTSFLRRTPDPTIQLVRRAALERVRRADGAHTRSFIDLTTVDLDALMRAPFVPPLHERVAAENHAMVAELGAAVFASRLDEIRADRDAAYARILAGVADPGVPHR